MSEIILIFHNGRKTVEMHLYILKILCTRISRFKIESEKVKNEITRKYSVEVYIGKIIKSLLLWCIRFCVVGVCKIQSTYHISVLLKYKYVNAVLHFERYY